MYKEMASVKRSGTAGAHLGGQARCTNIRLGMKQQLLAHMLD